MPSAATAAKLAMRMGKAVQFQGGNRPGVFQPEQFCRKAVPHLCYAAVLLAALCTAGCSGPQSALAPAGRAAEQISDLFWWMACGALVVWGIVVGLALYSLRHHVESARQQRQIKLLVIGGGVSFPTIVLAGLLAYGLRILPDLTASAPEGSLRITVTGEQWWWRVQYELPNQAPVTLANEIRLPVNEPAQFILYAPDVIHSFWIPALAGKMDMIPGRVTELAVLPTRTGVFRGQCAEYCGASHAWMAFDVVVTEKEEFELWLARQSAPAQEPSEDLPRLGSELFITHGCGACHTVRGTSAQGIVGPDLTHVGSRLTLAAGTLSNTPAAFLGWIRRPELVKPGVHMPHFSMLPEQDLHALAAYLEQLE